VAFTSLRQRLIFLLLLPVAGLLTALGVAGFFFARAQLLDQWRTTALISLERAAHVVDMRLGRTAQMVETLGRLGRVGGLEQADWRQALAQSPGVARVELGWQEEGQAPARRRGMGMGPGRTGDFRGMGMRFHRVRVASVESPRYDPRVGQDTVRQVFELKDREGRTVGRLEVELLFDHLLAGLQELQWWRSRAGYLVDSTGRILARTGEAGQEAERLGEDGDPLEVAALEALLTRPAGTVLGRGHPAERVAGFYRLARAPWTLVLVAPGQEVLGPVVGFLRVYVVVGAACVAVVLVLILVVTGGVASSVRQVCQAARRVAAGDYQVEVAPPGTKDELQRLSESFNTMVEGLREKEFIRDTFGRYVDQEVARQLLSRPEASRLGGDRRTVAVMMTDMRGFTSLCEELSPEETIALVNRYLSRLIEVIHRHQGIIVDFLGDSVLAFFDSLGRSPAEAARRAACCALELRGETAQLGREARDRGLSHLATGIGLHLGEVVVGNIGSAARTKYGIVGGPVNLTHRIQAQAAGGQVVASEELRRALPGLVVAKSFTAALKGLDEPATLHVVEDLPECFPGQPPASEEEQ
jgi:class 3 adenylate cyclase